MLVLGHRGAVGATTAPCATENTLAAVRVALDAGADGVEIDVRLTADGVAVCCHDDDLTRVGAPAVTSVRSTRWDALSRVRLADGSPVPRLDEVVDAVRGRGQLVLDLKPEPRAGSLLRASLAALTVGRADLDTVTASSFDDRLLAVLAVRRPGLARAAILDVGEPLEPALERARRRGDAAVHAPVQTVLSEHTLVEQAPVTVRVWTVNRPVDARLCALLGCDAVITDDPGLMVSSLARVAA